MKIQLRNGQKQNHATYIASNVYFEEILVRNKYMLFLIYDLFVSKSKSYFMYLLTGILKLPLNL